MDCFGNPIGNGIYDPDGDGWCGTGPIAPIPFPQPGEDTTLPGLGGKGRGVYVHVWAVLPGQPLASGTLLTPGLPEQRLFRAAISCTYEKCAWKPTPNNPDYNALAPLPAGGFYPDGIVEHEGPHREVEAPAPLGAGGGVAVPLIGPVGLGIVFLLLSWLGVRAVRRSHAG